MYFLQEKKKKKKEGGCRFLPWKLTTQLSYRKISLWWINRWESSECNETNKDPDINSRTWKYGILNRGSTREGQWTWWLVQQRKHLPHPQLQSQKERGDEMEQKKNIYIYEGIRAPNIRKWKKQSYRSKKPKETQQNKQRKLDLAYYHQTAENKQTKKKQHNNRERNLESSQRKRAATTEDS